MYYLKQSTASQEVLLGPFVDSTDGNTAETGLTIANTDIKIHVAGATTLASKNSGGATHISNGNYYAVLDATDTATLGSGCIVVQVAGALAVRVDICILAANVYDSLIGGGDVLDVSTTQFNGSAVTQASGRPEVNLTHIAGSAVSTTTAQLGVNAVQISGDGTAADNLETAYDDTAGAVRWDGVVDQGTAQSATGTTLVLRAAAAFADDELIGATLLITGGTTGVGQSRLITDYVSTTDTATVATWTTTPTGTITYKIYGTAPASAGGAPTAAEIADAVWDEATTSHTTSGTFGEQCKTDIDAILVDTGTTLDGMITTIDDFLDTEVAAIKTKTDFLPSATAGAAGGVFIAGTNAATTITTSLTTTFTGSLTGSVGSVTGAVGSVTGAVGSVTGAVGSVTGLTASDVGSIKTKTDSLTFTVANVLDANVQRINDVTIVGDGAGTPFNV